MADPIHRHSDGVFVIAATPFTDDGALDLDSTDTMVDFYLGTGVSGMTILGIMGEAPKLSSEESTAFARRVIDRIAGRVPVIVGVSAAGHRPDEGPDRRGDGRRAPRASWSRRRRASGPRIGCAATSRRSARRWARTCRSACRTTR